MNILIIGSGGHALVVADIISVMEDMKPLGFISGETTVGREKRNLPVLGDDNDVPSIPHDSIVLAIGDNGIRKKVHDFHTANGESLISAIHPSAIIAKGVTIEPGCMICAGVVINSGSRIGGNTILNTGCTVDHDCVIGPHAFIAPGVNLAGNVTIREGALVGIGACAIQGITIGEWATVGAGGAVIKDVAPETTVVGVPARIK